MEEVKRVVKWSEEAKKFWEAASNNSVELHIAISYACTSQTERGFEDLVNTINSPAIKNKLKRVIITDASYLYRHCIPEFASYRNSSTPSVWFNNNKKAIKSIQVDTFLEPWAEYIEKPEFKEWYDKIKADYEGNEFVRDFRDQVWRDASVAAYKGKYDIKDCIAFMLEECAYACAFFHDNLCYPTTFTYSMANALKRYKKDIPVLSYKISKYAQKYTHYGDNRFNMYDKEIALFMKEQVSNVNFFVIDKEGNHIYKNYALERSIGIGNVKDTTPLAWQNNLKIMKEKKSALIEETYKNKTYLSAKAPLIIDDEVEGVIGLAVDITEKKEKEKLEKEKETYDLVKSIAHDIRTPLCVLATVAKEVSLPESQHAELRNAVEKIDRILSELLVRYNENIKFQKEQHACIQIALKEVVKYSSCKYPNSNFEYIDDENAQDYIFVKADYSDFCRAMINLINNAAEACEEGGKVRVGFVKEGGNVIISVKDNGVGMSSDTVERINSGGKVLEIKKNGHGLGLPQVQKVIEDMHGKLTVQSKKNEGSEFTISAAICETPRWFSDSIRLKRGDIVVALDDDPLMRDVWKRIFTPFEKQIALKFFEKGLEAISFINSLKDKSKVFLLVDYELRNQPLNGIDVIERTGLQERHLLVTSMYVLSVTDFDKKSEFLKTFYKNGSLDKLKIYVE